MEEKPRKDDGAADSSQLTSSQICDLYADRVYRFASIIAKGDVEADDLAHDALVRVIRYATHYDPRRGNVESWLWRIVLNQARDTARLTVRRWLLFERLHSAGNPLASAEGRAIDRLTTAELLSTIRQLPKKDRQLLGLRFGAELSFNEIGTVMGASEAAVAVATRRALAKLRSIWRLPENEG
jgi:RNA polymerase sigma-70 factor (ECF subfamily)